MKSPSPSGGGLLWSKSGVDDGDRTRDDWNHNPGLYQLSYTHHTGIYNLSALNDFCKREI